MRDAVITIHGIRWNADRDWQNRTGIFLKTRDPDLKVFHFRFGNMLATYSYLIRVTDHLNIPNWFRNRYEKKFVKFIRDLKKEFPFHRFSILAHSFGGYIAQEAIARAPDLNLKNVIFMHCPISCHIENSSYWNWLESGRLNAVFAWSSHNDPVIGKVAVKPFGQNGYWGFIRMGEESDRRIPKTKPYPIPLYNEHTEEDHGGVLRNLGRYGRQIYDQIAFENEEKDRKTPA